MANDHKLHTTNGIRALAVRERPYWDQLPGERGRAIGVRKTEHGVHWLCRSFDAGTRQYKQVALTAANNYDEARKMASEVFKHTDAGGERTKMTFGEYFDEHYCPSVKASTSHSVARKTLGALANTRLSDLNARHVTAWRNSDLLTKDKDGKPRPIATMRRIAAPIRAALNKAVDDGFLPDRTWRDKLRFVQSKVEAAQVTSEEVRQYLTPAQRRALIEHAGEDFRPLLTMMASLPCRPGDFPGALVKDLDLKNGTIFLASKDHPRHCKLAAPALKLLAEHSAHLEPGQPLFSIGNDGKTRWHRNKWREALLQAAQRANDAQKTQGIPKTERVPLNVTAYDLRHSSITDLLEGNHSVAQVAFLAATSVAMIDQHYRKIIVSKQQAALDDMANMFIV